MQEIHIMTDITIPEKVPNFDEGEWMGSIQQLLFANVGKFVRVEYEAGLTQQGVIYAVGTNYLLLWDESRKAYSTGDTANLRSLTVFPAKVGC